MIVLLECIDLLLISSKTHPINDGTYYRNLGNFHVKIIHVININFRGSRLPTKIFLHEYFYTNIFTRIFLHEYSVITNVA